MKKSIFSVLTFALVMGGVSVMSSCKDYDDDLRTEYNSQLANLDVKLNEKIDQQIGNLNSKLEELEARLDAIKQCNCGVDKPWASDLATAIQNALDEMDKKIVPGMTDEEVRQIVTEILTKELTGYYDKGQIDLLISKIEKCSCDIPGELEKLKTEMAYTISTAITTTVTKEYIHNLLGTDYANQDQIASLQAQIDALASQACTCGDLAAVVQQLKSDLADAQKTLKEHGDDITALYKLYNELNNTLTDVASKADNALKQAEAAQKDATAAVAKAEDAVKKADKAIKTVEALGEDVAVLKRFKEQWENTLYEWKAIIPQMNETVNNLKNTVDGLKSQVEAISKTANEALTKATEALNKVNTLDGKVKTLEQGYNNLKSDVDGLKADMSDMKDQVYINRDSIEILQKEIDALTKQVYVNRDSIAILKAECDANFEAAKAYADEQIEIAIAAFEVKITGDLNALKEKVEAIDKNTNARIDSINNELIKHFGPDAERFENVVTDLEKLEKEVSEKYVDLDVRLEKLETWKVYDFNAWQEWVNHHLKWLDDCVAILFSRLGYVESELQKLYDVIDRVDAIDNTLKAMITGINVNQVYNPVFGSINFPMGTKSQVLVAFYGENEGDNVVFPSQSSTNYLFENEVFTDEEWAMISGTVTTQNIKAGKKLIEDRDDNAGMVYLTINPNTVDFTGVTLDLVNSQDEACGMVLSPLAKSDKVLDFGYTRAANNGFYEMAVKMENSDDVAKVSLETERFKEIAADLKNIFKNFDLTRLATTLYDQFNSMLPANALKATWTDGDGVEHSVLSDYTVAATAVKPLSYKFLADKHYTSISALDQIESFIDKAAKNLCTTLKKEISKAVNIKMPQAPNIKKFALEGTDYEKELAKFKIDADASFVVNGAQFTIDNNLNIIDADGKVIGTLPADSKVEVKDGTMTVHVTMDVRDVLGTMYTDICTNVNDLVQALNDYCEDATEAVKQLDKITESVDKIAGSLTGSLTNLLNKIESTMVSVLNIAISRLQPVMLMTADGRVKRMSPAVNYPTSVSETTIKIHPYSYNAEILNPAYLKHVAVVNVIKGDASAQDGDADCKAELDAINALENMNQPINGSIHEIEISGLKSGYTYQFAYTAMDYTGVIVTKRNAIRVK